MRVAGVTSDQRIPVAKPESERTSDDTIILPLYPGMTVANQDHVIAALVDARAGVTS